MNIDKHVSLGRLYAASLSLERLPASSEMTAASILIQDAARDVEALIDSHSLTIADAVQKERDWWAENFVTKDELTAAVQGEREARHELNDCAQCGATLHPPTDPPHCEDCIVDEEHREAWEDKRERPASAVVAKREREACAACDGKGQIPEPWSGDNSVVPCPHCFGNGMRTSRRPSAVDVIADALRKHDRLWCEALVAAGDLRVIEAVTKYVIDRRPESVAALVDGSPKPKAKPRSDWRCTNCGEKFDIDDAKVWRLNAGQLAHNCTGAGFFVAKNYARDTSEFTQEYNGSFVPFAKAATDTQDGGANA